jgi:hypothetical protein
MKSGSITVELSNCWGKSSFSRTFKVVTAKIIKYCKSSCKSFQLSSVWVNFFHYYSQRILPYYGVWII